MWPRLVVCYIGKSDFIPASEVSDVFRFSLLKDRVDAFYQYLARLNLQGSSSNPVDFTALVTYQEDMHWLLLITGKSQASLHFSISLILVVLQAHY